MAVLRDVSPPHLTKWLSSKIIKNNLNTRTLTSAIQDVLEVAKCPVCLCILHPPICLCENGHGICSRCKQDLTECPTCRGSFSNIHPLLLDNIIQILPKMCMNQDQGCVHVAVNSLNDNHEAVCPLRIVPCHIKVCKWSGKANTLLQHIQTNHNTHIFNENSNVRWFIKPSNKNKLLLSPVSAYDCIFWKYAKLDVKKKKLLIFFHCVPISEHFVDEFYSVVTFFKEGSPIEYRHSQKCLTGDINYVNVFEEENCTAIPFSTLPVFIDDKSVLKYKFSIVKFDDRSLNKIF